MKGLEALKSIKKSHIVAMSCLGIEKEDTETLNAINTIEKELKALEIIRKNSFLVADNHGERIIISIFDHFTPENVYLLIKEVLIHDKSNSTK